MKLIFLLSWLASILLIWSVLQAIQKPRGNPGRRLTRGPVISLLFTYAFLMPLLVREMQPAVAIVLLTCQFVLAVAALVLAYALPAS
jgi:hypothetical protein